MPGRLVLIDDTLVDHAVDDRDGRLIGCCRSIFVTFLYRDIPTEWNIAVFPKEEKSLCEQ